MVVTEINQVESYNFYVGEFTTTIYVGTPPQAIDGVVLDTGSNMPWFKVKGQCTLASCPGVTPIYNPLASSSFKSTNRDSSNSYNSGSTSGRFDSDIFCFNMN